MAPQVSVVIPCYNHAHYLGCAVESILAQTFADWEAIIVDDGSTDETPAVAAQFTDPRIRTIRQANQGLSAARNAGITASRGIFLAFLDADDEMSPRFLERCVAELARDGARSDGAQSVGARSVGARSDGALSGVFTLAVTIDPDGRQLPQIAGQAVAAHDFRARLLEGGFFPPCTVLVRADQVRAAGLFDTALTSLEDWDLWIRLPEHRPMQGIPEALARYRVYPGSMSTNAERMHANRIAVLTKNFGPPSPPGGSQDNMPAAARSAYGFAYRCTAIEYVQQGQWDRGFSVLEQGLAFWPPLLSRLDTFYELACGDQPRGYRGQADMVDVEGNSTRILRWLDALFAKEDPQLAPYRRQAYGYAHLAPGMLHDQAGQWTAARRFVAQAIRENLRLAMSPAMLRRLLKLYLGPQLIGMLRKYLKRDPLST